MRAFTLAPLTQSALRVIAGLLFFEHGLQKISHFPPALAAKAAAHGLSPMMTAAGFIELACGALITLGLFGRAASFIAAGEMAFAYFLVHAKTSPFPVNNQGDAAILFCFAFLHLAVAGPGLISLDALFANAAATDGQEGPGRSLTRGPRLRPID